MILNPLNFPKKLLSETKNSEFKLQHPITANKHRESHNHAAQLTPRAILISINLNYQLLPSTNRTDIFLRTRFNSAHLHE